MKKLLFICIMFLHIAGIDAQKLPSIKGYTWGTKYETILKTLQTKKIDYMEYSEGETSIICEDYHLLMSQIGFSEGYNTVFRFNKNNELFCILIVMRQDRFDRLQENKKIRNITDFITITNMEWKILRKEYGEETFKNLPDASKRNVEQKILWSFEDGAIELWRAWYGTYRNCKEFVFYVAIQCENYVD